MSTTYIEPEDIAVLNRLLLETHGKLQNKPTYRIVWSDAQTEHRKVFHVVGIQLLHPEVREVLKYPYAKSLWVMERWIPHLDNPEIASIDGGSYEPVWTFRDTQGKPLRPVWPAVELIAMAAEGLGEKRTVKDDRADDEKALNSEISEFEDMLANEGTNYGNQTDAFVKPMFVDSTKVFKG